MGNYHTFYIGAGIEFLTQTEEYESQDRKCNCRYHNNEAHFCSSCGGEIKTIKTIKNRTLWCEDLIGNESFMQFFKDSKTIFLSNHGHGNKKIEIDSIETITELSNKALILEFKDKHKKDIEELEKRLRIKLKAKVYCIHDYS